MNRKKNMDTNILHNQSDNIMEMSTFIFGFAINAVATLNQAENRVSFPFISRSSTVKNFLGVLDIAVKVPISLFLLFAYIFYCQKAMENWLIKSYASYDQINSLNISAAIRNVRAK